MNIIQKGVLALLKSAVSGVGSVLPDEFTIDSGEVRNVVKRHHLATLVYEGALKCGISSDTPFMKGLFKVYYKHMLRSEQQMMLVNTVFDAFDRNGIDYLPTKGCNMKAFYPKPELRLMGDADITVRAEQIDRISAVLQEMDFTPGNNDDNDSDWNKGVLHLELHKKMSSFYKQDYYDDVWSRVKLLKGNRYVFTTEDAFIHLFNHFARHYRKGGIGIRHVLDLYVYRMKYPEMDEEYIYQEMCVLKLQNFYKNVLSLLAVWFEDGQSDQATEVLTEVIFNSGSWGDVTSYVLAGEVTKANQDGEISGSKRKAVLGSLFPPKKYMRINYGFLDKYPFLLPVAWGMRGFAVLKSRRKNLTKRAKAWKTVEDKTVAEKQRQFKIVGLDVTE